MASLTSQLILALRDRVTGPARRLAGALNRLTGQQAAFAGGIGRSVIGLAAIGAGFAGVTLGIGGAIRGAMDFETAMTDLAKKSTLTDAQLAGMSKRIIELSNSMPLTAVEIANLIAQAAQFGIANEELERFALLGAKAAVAFDMDPRVTAESLSKIKLAYGLTMEQLELTADAINHTADSAGTSEADLIDFLTRVAGNARQFGITAEEVTAFGAALIETGRSSQVAATGVNAMMVRMSALTANSKAVQLLDAIGGGGYSERLQRQFYETPIEAMREMFRVTQQMSTEQRAGFFLQMFGMEYGDDAAAIANSIEAVNRRLNDLGDAGNYAGSVNRTFDLFTEDTAQRLRVLGNNIRNISTALGGRLLIPIGDFADKLAATLRTLDERVTVFDEIAAGIRGINAGLGLDPSQGLADIFGKGWDAIFGDASKFEEDTENLARIFYQFREMGASARAFGEDIGEFVARMEDLLGLDEGAIGETLGTVAKYGFMLFAASVGVRMIAGAILGLAKALMILSGATLLLGGVKGIAALFGALAGAGAAGAGAGAGLGAALAALRNRLLTAAKFASPLAIGGALLFANNNSDARDSVMWDGDTYLGPPDDGTDSAAFANEGFHAQRAAAIGEGLAEAEQRAAGLREQIAGLQEEIADNTMGGMVPPYLVEDLRAAQVELDATEAKMLEARAAIESHMASIAEARAAGATPIPINVDSSAVDTAIGRVNSLIGRVNALRASSATLGPAGATVPIDGARAAGGPVSQGGLYLVGEEGPELFRAGRRGHVFNADDSRSIMAGGGGGGSGGAGRPVSLSPTVNINLGGVTIAGQVEQGIESIARELGDRTAAALRGHFADWV